jgi:tetratricopeptide (TPR) repeat protein
VKRSLIFIILLGCLTSGGLFFYFKSQKAPEPVPQTMAQPQGLRKVTSRRMVKAKDVYSQSIKTTIRPGDTNIPRQCKTQWRQMIDTKLDDLSIAIKAGDIGFSQACIGEEQKVFAANNLVFHKMNCAAAMRDDTENGLKQREECLRFLAFYRAHIIDLATGRNEEDIKNYDAATLMNKILAFFSSGMMDPKQAKYALKLVEALIAKEPDLYSAYKAKATILFINAVGNGGTLDNEAFEQTVRECNSFNTGDPELDEVQLMKAAVANAENLAEQIQAFIEANPDSAVGKYYSASSVWKQGDKAGAIRILEDALKIEPENERFKETLAKLQASAPKTEHLFESKLSVRFDDL